MKNPVTEDQRKIMLRIIYNLVTQNSRSTYLIKQRMFNPKVFCRQIENRTVFEESPTKYLAWLVSEKYLIQVTGRDYYTVYFQVTATFCRDLKKLTGFICTMPDVPLRVNEASDPVKKAEKKENLDELEVELKKLGDNSSFLESIGIIPSDEKDN